MIDFNLKGGLKGGLGGGLGGPRTVTSSTRGISSPIKSSELSLVMAGGPRRNSRRALVRPPG